MKVREAWAWKTKPFSEQVALVTGGATGIGRKFTEAIALRDFAPKGA